MNLNRIAERITELLTLKGFDESHTIDELKDHYLTHIEEEIKRGVNSQQAIRETFQEIANIDFQEFTNNNKSQKRNWILFLSIILLGVVYLFYPTQKESSNTLIAKDVLFVQAPVKNNIQKIEPPSGLPIKQTTLNITSDFGFRIHPVQLQKKLHRGIDIGAKSGTPVLATGDGVVLEAGYKAKPGKYIVIQHKGNYTTKYYHLSDLEVVCGTEVSKGQKIGEVGNSGKSYKSHLHYEILKDGVPINPRKFIRA